VSAFVGVIACVTVCVCMRSCAYLSDSVRVYVTVCVYMYHYAQVALLGEGVRTHQHIWRGRNGNHECRQAEEQGHGPYKRDAPRV
jgi:hypothetical protein